MTIKEKNIPNFILMVVVVILASVFFIEQLNPIQANQYNLTTMDSISEFTSYPHMKIYGKLTIKNGTSGHVFNQNGIFEKGSHLSPNSTFKYTGAYIINGHYFYQIGKDRYVIDTDINIAK